MTPQRLKFVLPFAILGVGLLGAIVLVATRPAVSVQPPEVRQPLVRVVDVEPVEHRLVVRTHGSVKPRTETDLVPEVSGPVIWMSASLASGGSFEKDAPLLRIDPVDYEVALERAAATLARTESEHQRARKEYKRQRTLAKKQVASPAQLDDAVSAERVAAAIVRESRAALTKAERDLARTEIQAPYAGRVREENVDLGQFVNRGTRIARIYAVDFAEVRLPVPDEQLAYLDLPSLYGATVDEGPRVTLRARFAGADRSWQGRIVRTEGEIDPKSRMVNVVARVEDPYGRSEDASRVPLAVGLFVDAEIEGRVVSDAVVLPRAALRQGDRVWVVDAEDRLRVRPIEVLRAVGDQVIVGAGLEAGERVCVSPLGAVSDGMAVRLAPRAVAGGAGS